MNHLSSHRKLSRISLRKAGIALSLTLASTLFAGATQAQVFVTDHITEASTLATKASEAAAVAKQIEQYAKQVQQYEAILTSINGMAAGGISLMPNTMQPIDNPSSLVQQSCPGAGGGGVMGALSSIVSSAFTQSITTSQQNICAQIVITQVDKYNKTIKVIQDMQQFGAALQTLQTQITAAANMGDSGRVTANGSVNHTQVDTDMADWDSQMKADDAIIATLSQQQAILAKVAMSGSNTPLGNFVQATTFVAAFQ